MGALQTVEFERQGRCFAFSVKAFQRPLIEGDAGRLQRHFDDRRCARPLARQTRELAYSFAAILISRGISRRSRIRPISQNPEQAAHGAARLIDQRRCADHAEALAASRPSFTEGFPGLMQNRSLGA